MRSRWLLVLLLVLLPVTVVLASPEQAHHLPSADTVQHESDVRNYSPSDTPKCHHGEYHCKTSVLIRDSRDAELPTPADNVVAIPSQGPVHNRLAVAEGPPYAAPSDPPHAILPVYLRTQRLRV